MKTRFVIIPCMLAFALTGSAQSLAVAPRQFEVASVKQNLSQSDASNISSAAQGRFVATNVPARFLILYAYDLLAHQLTGLPEWTSDKAFDIVGLYPAEHRPSDRETRLMLQNVLTERFALRTHHEQRDLPAYDLVVARNDGQLGPQIHKSEIDCAAAKRPQSDAVNPSPVSPSGKRPVCRMIATRRFLTGGTRTMHDVTGPLQAMLGRPVVDKTGLPGAYDLDLQWAPTDLHAEESAGSDGPSLFTALQTQLGLKLVPHKEKFDVLVVDDIRLPDAN
jgi:uncharacterized protein (TIGR03435 family)